MWNIEQRTRVPVLGTLIDTMSVDIALSRIFHWICMQESRYICFCNTHSVVTALSDPELQTAISQSDMASPDGAPVALFIRRSGYPEQKRICGPDIMGALCAHAAEHGYAVFFYGSTQQTLDKLLSRLSEKHSSLKIAGSFSPPFRELSMIEEKQIAEIINDSGASVVFVGLGCPKQEKWMSLQRNHINAVMLGVGAAFDYHAETVRRAPVWMRSIGLEWLYRLAMEPRRLWKRYLVTNSLFVYHALKQSMKICGRVNK